MIGYFNIGDIWVEVESIELEDGLMKLKGVAGEQITGSMRGQLTLTDSSHNVVIKGEKYWDFGVKLPYSKWDVRVSLDLKNINPEVRRWSWMKALRGVGYRLGRSNTLGGSMPPAKRGQRRVPAGAKSGGTKSVTRPSIRVQLQELSAANPTCCLLIHGDNGVGKTSLAGGATSSKRAGKITFCSTERGSISAKRTGSKAKLWPAPTWPHVEAFIDWADDNLGPDDWAILDSVTKMDILLQRDILRGDHEMRGKDLDTMELQHWPLWQTKFLRFIDRMVDSNYNTILICSSMEGTDRDGDEQIIPSVTDTRRSNKAGYVRAQPDEVYYYGLTVDEEGNPVRRLLTQYYPPWFAKSRYDIFERSIDVGEGEFHIMGWIIDQLMEARDEASA